MQILCILCSYFMHWGGQGWARDGKVAGCTWLRGLGYVASRCLFQNRCLMAPWLGSLES